MAGLVPAATVPKVDIERRLRGSVEDTNFKRELRLRALFEEAGCAGNKLTEQPVKHAQAPNVICTLAGSTDSIIIVGAHFDFVDRGEGRGGQLERMFAAAQPVSSLKDTPRRHTFVFIGFTNEEAGMVGSKFYVHQLSQEQLRRIRAMVNMDSLGLSPTKVERDRADNGLFQALSEVAGKLKLPLSVMNAHKLGRSDSDSFQDSKVPTINIHSVTQETWPILHSPRDQMSAIHLDDYYDTYLLLRAYLAYLDEL